MPLPFFEKPKRPITPAQPIGEYNQPDNYDIINNPIHYIKGRRFEPAFVINDWDLNWYVGTCVKYLSRLGRKDTSSKDISKALWYIVAEIANNHKDIPKEKVINTINEVYSRKEKYEQLKKE